MSFVSLYFIFFIFVLFGLYYILPAKCQWILLLLASLFFYYLSSAAGFFYVAISLTAVYVAARVIQGIYDKAGKDEDMKFLKKRSRPVLIAALTVVIFLLAVSKAGFRVTDALGIERGQGLARLVIVPMGISYYTFGLIGYLADVFWKKDRAQKNPLKLLLFMIFFPQIVEGPIPRHKKLAECFEKEHKFDYTQFCFGLQRILWGFFKKLVIADRLSVFTSQAFSNLESYEGLVLIIAVIFSAVQLYCDFSGCMDIALGVAQCLDIRLYENFNHPFFSKTAAEFWRRWHITLGAWFKDYVYMPMVTNPGLIRFCQKLKDRFSPRVAKNALSVIPLFVVWLLTGLWHGTGINYILWGLYWGAVIIFSTVFTPELKKAAQILHVNTNSKWFDRLRIGRTLLIFLISRAIVATRSLDTCILLFKRMFMKFNPWVFFDESLYTLGLDRRNMFCALIAMAVLWLFEYKQETGTRIRETVASYNIAFRWFLYLLLIFSVLILGWYGAGYNANDFIYMKY